MSKAPGPQARAIPARAVASAGATTSARAALALPTMTAFTWGTDTSCAPDRHEQSRCPRPDRPPRGVRRRRARDHRPYAGNHDLDAIIAPSGRDEDALDALAAGRDPPADPSGSTDKSLDVRAALATLVPDQRAALVLVDVLGYSIAGAAQSSACRRERSRAGPRAAVPGCCRGWRT
jgi:hypothetical protein